MPSTHPIVFYRPYGDNVTIRSTVHLPQQKDTRSSIVQTENDAMDDGGHYTVFAYMWPSQSAPTIMYHSTKSIISIWATPGSLHYCDLGVTLHFIQVLQG